MSIAHRRREYLPPARHPAQPHASAEAFQQFRNLDIEGMTPDERERELRREARMIDALVPHVPAYRVARYVALRAAVEGGAR